MPKIKKKKWYDLLWHRGRLTRHNFAACDKLVTGRRHVSGPFDYTRTTFSPTTCQNTVRFHSPLKYSMRRLLKNFYFTPQRNEFLFLLSWKRYLRLCIRPKNWGNIVYLLYLTYRCNIIAIVDLISAIAKFFPIQFLKHQFEMRFISEKGWCSEIRKLWFLHQKCDNRCVLLKSEELFLKLVSRLVL